MDHTGSKRFDQISAQAEALAQERFAFLVHDRGFTPGTITRTTYATSLYYIRTPELGLQVELAFQEAYIEVYLVRLRAGKPPRHLGTEANGTRIRTHLPHFLHRVLAVPDPWLDEVIRSWQTTYYLALTDGYRFADVVLTDLKNMVERYLDLVLEQPMEVLFPPPKGSRARG